MRFETIPAGESRQIDGPFFGLRVLATDANQGAALTIDRLALPLTVLPTYSREIDTILATGPITLALADGEDEDVTKVSASPAPPTGLVGLIRHDVFESAPGRVFGNTLATAWRIGAAPPVGADALAIWTVCGWFSLAAPSAMVYERGARSYFDVAPVDESLHGSMAGPKILKPSSGATVRNLFAWFGRDGADTTGFEQPVQFRAPFLPPAGIDVEVWDGTLAAGAVLAIHYYWLKV